MPDPEKKKNDAANQPDEDKVRDDSASEVQSDVPAIDTELDTGESGKEVAKDTPPDLAPEDSSPEEPDTAAGDDTTPFDDEKTDKAIDEIVAKESDDVLAAQDAASAKGRVKPPRKHGALRNFFGKKWVRWLLVMIIIGGIAAVMAVPKTRYLALNTAGVRSSSSLTIVDSTTRLPLKGVSVTLGGQSAKTDSDGEAKFTGLKLGKTQLTISRVGFEEIKRDFVIGWGSNPLGSFPLKATGVQYVIEVRDYLSDKPIEGVEATDGTSTAISGKDGKITLTLENTVVAKDAVSLSKSGYRTQKITLQEDPKKTTKASLVLARKTVFITKQSGRYDLYKSDIDGQNREVLLAGTGAENSNISLAVSPDGSRVAYVSTRDNKRDSGGFLLSSLSLINVGSGEKTTIAEAAQIQLIDWVGTRLVFQQATSDSKSGSRYTIISYNYSDNTRLQLAAANKFSAVLSARGTIYYAVAADASNPSLQLGLFKIGADSKGKQQVFDGELATVLRSTYNTLSLQDDEGTWYSYDMSSGAKSQVGTPASLANRLYIDNSDRSKSLYVNQGFLISYDVAGAKDTNVKSQSGLTYPLQWIGSAEAIYRVSSGSETADYAVSLEGGTARKIADVSATYGFALAQ